MVSSTVDKTLEELVAALQRFKQDYVDDPEWQGRRAEFPADWPL